MKYTFVAINSGRLTAGEEETYAFIWGLYEAGTFNSDRLAPWLRRSVNFGP